MIHQIPLKSLSSYGCPLSLPIKPPIPPLTIVKACLQYDPFSAPLPHFPYGSQRHLWKNANLTTPSHHFKLFTALYKAHLPFEKLAVIWPLPTCLASSLSTAPPPSSGSTCRPPTIFIHDPASACNSCVLSLPSELPLSLQGPAQMSLPLGSLPHPQAELIAPSPGSSQSISHDASQRLIYGPDLAWLSSLSTESCLSYLQSIEAQRM